MLRLQEVSSHIKGTITTLKGTTATLPRSAASQTYREDLALLVRPIDVEHHVCSHLGIWVQNTGTIPLYQRSIEQCYLLHLQSHSSMGQGRNRACTGSMAALGVEAAWLAQHRSSSAGALDISSRTSA